MERPRIPIFFMGTLLWCCLLAAASAKSEYLKYKDPKQPLNVPIIDLIGKMTLEEKIGQMVQIERNVTSAEVMTKYFIEPGPSTITNVRGTVKCVVIVVSGRPVVIQPYVASIEALVAAWVPGSEGQGVADVFFGDYGFTG